MTDPVILCEQRDGIAYVRFNRPHRLNAVVEPLYEALLSALDGAEKDRNVRVVVLTGAGRAFCVGADMKEHGAGTRSEQERRAYLARGNAVCERLYNIGKPVVAAVNGYAIGAGAEMAIACDFIVMKESAEIGLPEIGLGSHVGGATTVILPRLVGLAKARELIFLGQRIDGVEATRIGLATDAYPNDDFESRVHAFAAALASKAPLSMSLAKEHLNLAYNRAHDSVLSSELEAICACAATEDWQEGLDAFSERRAPVFRGR